MKKRLFFLFSKKLYILFAVSAFFSCELLYTIDSIIANTGTPEIKNKKDISVIVRRIKELLEKCEDYQVIISSPDETEKIINGLTNRFGISSFDAAAVIDTPGARQWAEQNLAEEYKLFKAVQKIIFIADDVNKGPYREGQKKWPGSNPYYGQTKTGLCVLSKGGELLSPWGEVKITGKVLCCGGTCLKGRLKVSACEKKEEYDSGCLFSVDAVGGDELPPAELLQTNQYRCYETVNFIWSVLDDRYKREIDHAVAQRNDEMYGISAKVPEAMPPKKEHYPLSSMHELSEWVVQLLKESYKNGESLEKYLFENPKKVCFETRCGDGDILARILSLHSPTPFSLYSGHRDPSCAMLHGKKIPAEFFDPKRYEGIVLEFTVGWRKCKLVDYPDIFHKESEEDYYLFIKKIEKEKNKINFGPLFRELTQKLDLGYLDENVSMYCTWKDSLKEHKDTDMAYLWIKKDKYEEVVEKMSLVIEKDFNKP